jgi:hypothetical protein
VRGGNNTNVTVTLNGVAPTGGITVATGDNSGNVGMPSSVFIPAGASSVTITIATGNVDSNQVKYIGANYDGIEVYDDLTLLD